MSQTPDSNQLAEIPENKVLVIAGDITLTTGAVVMDGRDEVYIIVDFITGKYPHILARTVTGEEKTIYPDSFEEYYRLAPDVDFNEADRISDQIIRGEMDISSLHAEEPQEQGLMLVDASTYLKRRDDLKRRASQVDAIQRMIKEKTDAIYQNVRGIMTQYNKVITKLNKIIFTLELYGGIEESIKQVQAGRPADDSEPIHLMQLMQFMDEEVGDPSNGGISYDTIEQFDAWMLSYNKFLGYHNYNLLIPHKKGVRIMRVRRKASEKYSVDVFRNSWHIRQEMRTYVIIRNGENIYTIDSKMQFSHKLFPDVDELTKFYEKGGDFDDSPEMEVYKHGMILMQGLVDRTQIFGNLYGAVSFLKNESVEKGDVVFNYENEDRYVTDGSLTALDFLNTSTIEAGDRVLIYNPTLGYNASRLYKEYFRNEFVHPPAPDTGIYKLEYDPQRKCLFFRYNPKDNVYTPKEGYHERKKGFSYQVNPQDNNVVNIDIVSHRNIAWIEKMMYDRRDRRQYLRAAGLLNAVKEFKRAELTEEEPFKSLIMSTCSVDEVTALDAIHWWKTKNKHKRALFVDDMKALRMITKMLSELLP